MMMLTFNEDMSYHQRRMDCRSKIWQIGITAGMILLRGRYYGNRQRRKG